MNTTTPKTRRTEERRRRRQGAQAEGRLGVDPNLLNESQYAYRWMNDEPGRLVTKTKNDDWDLVPNAGEKEDSTDLGDMVSVVVGTHPDGTPKRAYLCRKPKTYFEEDQKAAQDVLDEQLEQLRRGNDAQGVSQSDYVPKSGIKLR